MKDMQQHIELLSDEELCTAIFDKEALPEHLCHHLVVCEACQRRMVGYQQLHKNLLASLYRDTCPGSMEISMYCAHLLLPEQTTQIAAHVARCPLCADEVRDTRRFYKDIDGLV